MCRLFPLLLVYYTQRLCCVFFTNKHAHFDNRLKRTISNELHLALGYTL